MLFVKIKNLQQADFSIEEIRPLLEVDDDQLMEAFERKINEQTQKLERIRTIQRSYLKETMDMQKMVLTIADFVEGRMDDPRLWNEFGLDNTKETEINARVHEMLADWLTQCRNSSEEIAMSMNSDQIDTMKTVVEQLNGEDPDALNASASDESNTPEAQIPADAKAVFERSGWDHVSEWIDEMPALGADKQNFFLFRVNSDSPINDTVFPMLMLAVMAVRNNALQYGMYCNVGRSEDGLNHFTLYQK